MSDPSRPASPIRTAAVIPAAGRGVRLGPGAPKALRALGGTPMLVHAVRAMAASRAVSLVVVVAPPDGAPEVRHLLDEHPLGDRTDLVVVPGGATRQESVRLGQPVVVVPGHEEAFKVTRPLDLVLAEAVLARRRATDGYV